MLAVQVAARQGNIFASPPGMSATLVSTLDWRSVALRLARAVVKDGQGVLA